MAIGGSAQVAFSSRNTLLRKRLHKQLAARRMLLEALEGRQLMAVGPQLLGIQPNEGSLLTDGQVRKVAPNELVFRFDDRVGLDPNTLGGIRIIRSGDDGEFERASMATDLGTGGQTLVEFYSAEPGQVGNGIQISFTQANRTDSRAPVVRVNGRSVTVEMNSNPLLETRVDDLVRAFDQTIPTNTVTNLVYALRLRGSTTAAVGRTVDVTTPIVLGGANAAKITTDFGTGANLQVRLTAKESGTNGVGIKVVVTTRDFGGPSAPNVTISTDATTGKKVIAVELNSNTRFASTVSDFITALNGNAQASALLGATLISGSGASRLGTLTTGYSPLVLSGVTDVEIIPGYVGLGDTNREVVMRFAEALPDDRYRIEILGRGTRVLKNLNGVAYNDGIDTGVTFELDLGAQIQSIVPQPVERQANGTLKPNYNVIDVYFNNDDLINPGAIRTVNGLTIEQLRVQRPTLFFQSSDIIVNQAGSQIVPDALNPQFYQLFHLANTLRNTDDTRFLPSAVRYYPDADRVSLTFSRELGALVDSAGATLPISELRLRIGTNDPKPLAPVTYAPPADPADTFANAENLTSVWNPATGSKSIQISSTIQNTTPYLLDFPGGSDEIGGRYNRMQDHFRRVPGTGELVKADSVDGVSEIEYNFQSQLGVVNGTVLLNSITEQQKQRAREIFSLYERYLGVRFIETDTRGLTIAVGDLRSVVSPFPETSLTQSAGIPSVNAAGGEFLESGTLANGGLATVLDSQDFSSSVNNEFGGAFSRAVAQGIGNLLGLGATDDLEGFTTQAFNNILAPGVGTEIVIPGDAEIIHGQYLYRPDSKDIDLYQFRLPTSGRISIETFAERMSSASKLDTEIRLFQQLANGSWEEIAANDDYYSSDSFLELELGQGNYIVGVSASGNSQYDPTISDSGLGGRSQGKYDLRMDFRPPADKILKDATGTPIDGDADGVAGGVFDYWFRPSTAANTKYVDKQASAGGNGSITTPYKNIKDALNAAQPGDVVRIVGNGGADKKLNTPADNLPYEIGFNALGQALPDGITLDVPKDVSVLIDAGAILKLRRARVGVGSTSASVDRSAGTLAVLGTPVLVDSTGAVLKDAAGVPVEGSVYFTSIADVSLGVNSSPAVNGTKPTAGDWGGIDFRNRIDNQDEQRKNFENRGQFLNWVSHASIKYGGGQVVVDGVSQVITPIQMFDARPTVVYSSITSSADAAMSATPNSFKESDFHTPDEQRAGAFSSDYTRVGPEIHGNTVTGNTLNGLQVRVRTGTTTELMTVAGRMDDTDIVHIIPENLVIAGTPGGMLSDTVSPPATIVTLTGQAGGTLPAGKYSYRLTYVDASGNESGASEATQSITVAAGSSIVLQNLPAVRSGSQYVGRRLYRSDISGSGNYVLVRELNASSTTIVDTGTSLGSALLPQQAAARARLDGRLAIDGGTVVKLLGSRIEVQFGAQLIAEGTEDRSVVFTSTNDVRYGAGGTFATSASGQAAARGNWGGIYLSPTSSASLDHAVIAYGGGTTRIEGGFAEFSALETHQSDLRLSNSKLELNAAGNFNSSTSDRGGRGANSESVVFVRGAQPVLVDNVVVNNSAAAFSVNVSALNNVYVADPGRSTGELGRVTDRLDNQGPLIVGNRLDRNSVNGLVVRGGTLTTEGVWDDTDIVHVVRETIDVPNFHTYGGLRLESSSTQSLVVKLLGAGINADGELIDNADRIGGSVQLVGTPGNPVLMTSANDCSVGVGFTPDGRPQTDTLNTACGTSFTVSPYADVIVVMDDSGSMTPAQQFSSQLIKDLDTALLAAGVGSSNLGVNRFGLVAYGGAFTEFTPGQVPLGAANSQWGTSAQFGAGINTLTAGGATEDGYLAIDYAIDNYSFRPAAERFVILVTNEDRDIVDSSKSFASTLTKLRRNGVTLNGIVEADFFAADGTPAIALDYKDDAYLADGQGGYTTSPNGFARDNFSGGTTVADYVDLIHETKGIAGDIEQIQIGGATTTSFSKALITTIVAQASGGQATAGDWSSVLIGPNSNDRNVAMAVELEPAQSASPNANGTPDTAEFLGELASDLNTSDEVRRLGYQVKGTLSKATDVDVYSFRATAGTEVWLDIDRTQNSLDTVVELVDANGRILALSNDSLAEEGNPALLYSATEMPGQSVHSLRKSTPDLYLKNATGTPKDLYSTNARDAGMRVVLPGEPGSPTLYHVRVRSSNLRVGDAATRLIDPAFVNSGLTKGVYQLQIRLREIDEVPGSSVNYADLRFATNGIQVVGTRHSPLLGESAETVSANDTLATAQPLGNLLVSDKQAISIAGSLSAFSDVDWYSFTIDYSKIRASELRRYFSTVFDMDYADGTGRPDTSIYVFNSANQLILGGLSSNLVDDQATGLSGAGGVSDQSRGSAGALDPFVGTVELPVGQYFLAVTSSEMIPRALTAYLTGSNGNATLRLQPTNGVQLIAEDHIDNSGGSTAVAPVVPVLFPNQTNVNGQTQFGNPGLELDLSEVPLFVSTRPFANNNSNAHIGNIDDATDVFLVNALTGEISSYGGRIGQTVLDIAFKGNGELQAFDVSPQPVSPTVDQDNLMDYLQINVDPTNSGVIDVNGRGGIVATDEGGLGIQTVHANFSGAAGAPPTIQASDDGIYPNAITFVNINGTERGLLVGSRGQRFLRDVAGTNFQSSARPLVDYIDNIVYGFDPATGTGTSGSAGDKTFPQGSINGAGTFVREYGFIDTTNAATARRGLIGLDATKLLTDGSTQRVIVDGQSFTILDSSGFTNRFEFDSGPEVRITYNPVNGPSITDGLKFTLNSGVNTVYEFEVAGGIPGVSAGAVAIPLSANPTVKELVDAISQRVGNGVTVSSKGDRMNFSGALTGDFTELVNRGIFVDRSVTGNVTPLAIKVPFLVADTAEDIAARVAIAIRSASVNGVPDATASGPQVSISGGVVQTSTVLPVAGAPGGKITGTAVLNGVMYAVSDAGGLYRVNTNLDSPTVNSFGNIGTYVNRSFDLLGINFAGLTTAPDDVLGGALSNMLIGIDTQGTLYAFNSFGELQNIFKGGSSSVATPLRNVTGLAFSTLDNNLWHVTNSRQTDAGHGLPVPPDNSRTAVPGGSSLYFGTNNNPSNYNFMGGAAGAVESQTIDLSGVSAGALPTLYFNYFLATEGASFDFQTNVQNAQRMRDSLRVYISGEDGIWQLAATNNSAFSSQSFDEYDLGTDVQELFDNTNQWRQARVPLDDFAGQANVKIRVEFSSAGSFGFGAVGGKGPQMRLKSGDRLVDGQTFTIGSKNFEIKTGPVLGMPAGSALTPGDSVTIEGVTYVFTDGTLAVVSPNVPVVYDNQKSASDIANLLLAAINSAARPKTTLALSALAEGNDTMATALRGPTSGDSSIVTVSGFIGDNPVLVGTNDDQDVDMVRVELARGSTLVARANKTAGALDTYLRLFDSAGNELAANDNDANTTDSRITFTVPADGVYYLGVSGAGNNSYRPNVFGTTIGGNKGSYDLTLDITRQFAPVVKGERLQLEGAANVSRPLGSPIVLTGSAKPTNGFEPVYVNFNMTANQVGQALKAALVRAYDSTSGLAFTLRGDTLDLTGFASSQVTGGPFGLTTTLSGDQFGSYNSNMARGFNNAFEGVHLDDFIIGLAGRGEMAMNAPADTTFVQRNPTIDANKILQGPYQLEIRGGSEYGAPLTALSSGSTLNLVTANNPLGRLAQGVSLQFNDASGLVAGTTFTISDGTRSLTFELDNQDDAIGPKPGNVPLVYSNRVPNNTVPQSFRSDTAAELAERFTDLMNSSVVQSVLDIGAILVNGNSASGSSTVTLTGQANVTVPTSIAKTIVTKGVGDANRVREQGQVVIQNAKVSRSAGFGISIAAAGRDANGNPIGGTPRNLLSINTERLVPGAVVMNSQFIDNASGGISISGEAVTTGVPAPVPYARIVNNTIVGTAGRGGTGAGEIGISVTANASPTLLNNIVANLGTGLSIDASSATSVVGGMVYHRNAADVAGVATLGQFAIDADDAQELFRDVVNGNLYPRLIVPRSGVVSNASNTDPIVITTTTPHQLNDGDSVKIDGVRGNTNANGNFFARVLTPTTFALYTDSLLANSRAGNAAFSNASTATWNVGSDSVIIDSAIDSLQDRPSLVTVKNSIGIGPSPVLAPQYDANGLLRVDDPSVASPAGFGENIFKDRGAQDRADFIGPSVIMLTPVDNDIAGLDTNPAPSIVELTNFTPTRFDIQLFDGLEPSDPFRGTSIDDSTVKSGSVLVYKDGVPLVDGIDYRFGYDATSNVIRLTPLSGVFDSSSVYQIRLVNSREFAITTLRGRDYSDGSTFNIVDTDNKTTTFELDTGYLINVPSADGVVADIIEGAVLTFDDGVRRLTFELDKDNSFNASNIRVALTANASPTEVATKLRAALVSAGMQFTIVDLGSGRLQIDGSPISFVDIGTSGILLAGKPGVRTAFGIQIPVIAGRPVALQDGETFTINRTTSPVTFELDSNGVVTPGRIPVRFTAGASAAAIGQSLVNAIRGSTLGLLPTYAGNGLVVLGGDANTVLDVSNTQLRQAGTPGVAAARAIQISAATSIDQVAIANQITAAINGANLPGVSATAFGDRVVISGAVSVGGDQAELIQNITDFAGNALKPNQTNGQTTLTVFLGEGLDYGDAPDPKYATKRDNNGPRHTVVSGFSLGADVRPDADAKVPDADEFDDGVQFSQMVAAFQSSATVTVNVPNGTSAYLSAWIDYNQDGVFSNTERIANALAVTAGTTTLSFLVSGASTSGTTYARFRLSSDPTSIANPTGVAPDGEVEDYAVTIVGNPYKNQTNGLDVNGDGKVSPIDALNVINYLNGPLPKVLTLPHTAAAPYIDVNGDGNVTPLDALLVIGFLNSIPPSGGEGEDIMLDSASLSAGSGVAEVSSGNWMQGIEQLAAPAVQTKVDAPEETVLADAFFATIDDDLDQVVAADTTVQRGSVIDDVLMTMSSSASEVADEVVTSQAGWMMRQRLASAFRR